MKIRPEPTGKKSDNGLITVVFITLLAIMMILVMAESRALIHLRRETKFLEQQQIKRLNASVPINPTTTPTSK